VSRWTRTGSRSGRGTSFERQCVGWLLLFRAPLLTRRVQPHYAPNSNSILISSTLHRSQAQNIDDCLSKVRLPPLSPNIAALTRGRS
jgi:hypothetical protein